MSDEDLRELSRKAEAGDHQARLRLAVLNQRISGEKADSHAGPWVRSAKFKDRVFAFLQWKGGPCVDSWCPCGAQGHRCDTEFMYYLRCDQCGRVFFCNPHIELVELTPEEIEDLKKKSPYSAPWKSNGSQAGLDESFRHHPDSTPALSEGDLSQALSEFGQGESPHVQLTRRLVQEIRTLREALLTRDVADPIERLRRTLEQIKQMSGSGTFDWANPEELEFKIREEAGLDRDRATRDQVREPSCSRTGCTSAPTPGFGGYCSNDCANPDADSYLWGGSP